MKILSLCLAAAVALASANAQQESLGERTAAAKSGVAPLPAEKAGSVVGSDYRNSYFGFEIHALAGWESQNRGQLNLNEALGREALGQSPGISPSGRVFGMHDGLGSSLIVSIREMPPGSEMLLNQRNRMVEDALKKVFPDPTFSPEPALLGDKSHAFTAFRMSYVLRGQTLHQSSQATFLRGHLLDFTITANSEQELTNVLHQLRGSIKWTD